MAAIIQVAILITMVSAWVQHFITSVSEEMWVLLFLGAFLPPIGILHGVLVWLGVL